MLNGKPKTDISNVKKRLDNVFGSYNKFTELINLSPVISSLTLSMPSSSSSFSLYNNSHDNQNQSNSLNQLYSNSLQDTLQQISDNETGGFGLMTSAAASNEKNGYNKSGKFLQQRLPTKEVLQSMQNLIKDDLLTNLECSKNMNCIVEDNSVPSTSTQNLHCGKTSDRKRNYQDFYELSETQNKKLRQEDQKLNKISPTLTSEIPSQLIEKSNRELQKELFGDFSDDDDSLTSDEKSLVNSLTPSSKFLKQNSIGSLSIPISPVNSSSNLTYSKTNGFKSSTQNNSNSHLHVSLQSQKFSDKEKEKLKEKEREKERVKEKEVDHLKDIKFKKEKKFDEFTRKHKKKKEYDYDKFNSKSLNNLAKNVNSPKIDREHDKVERIKAFEKLKKSEKEKSQLQKENQNFNNNTIFEAVKLTKSKGLTKEDKSKNITSTVNTTDYLKGNFTNSSTNITNAAARSNAGNSVHLQQTSKSSSPTNSVLNGNCITIRNNNDDLHSPDSGFVDGNGLGSGNVETPSSVSCATSVVSHRNNNFLSNSLRSGLTELSNRKSRIESILEQITYVTPLLSPISNLNCSMSPLKRDQKTLKSTEKANFQASKNNYLSDNYEFLPKKEFQCELKFDSFAMSSGQTLADLVSEKWCRIKPLNSSNYDNETDMEIKTLTFYKPELQTKPYTARQETDYEKELAKTEAIFEERIKIKDKIIENHELVIAEQRTRLQELERISKNYDRDLKLREQIISDLRLEKDALARRNELLLDRNQRLTKELERMSRELEILKREQPLNASPWSSYQN